MNLFVDIETVPCQRPDALERVRSTLKPPAIMKKAETIAAWWANESEAAAVEVWRKQALDGGNRGEIVSVALVADGTTADGSPMEWVKCRAPGESEAALLRYAFDVVEHWTAQELALVAPSARPATFPIDDHYPVAHNAAFDLGFLWRRAVVLGVPVPRWLPGPAARAGQHYGCTMLAWAGFGGKVSLDTLCEALGLPSPKDEGMDGSKVFDAWQAGQLEELERYNLDDARAVSAIWHRLASCHVGTMLESA